MPRLTRRALRPRQHPSGNTHHGHARRNIANHDRSRAKDSATPQPLARSNARPGADFDTRLHMHAARQGNGRTERRKILQDAIMGDGATGVDQQVDAVTPATG